MRCPFCKEDILEGAIKCRHCGSMLSDGSEAVMQGIPAFAMSCQDTSCQVNKVDNTLVWILAFAPILGAICGQVLKDSLESGWMLQFPTLALNIVLAVMDQKKLRQQGYDTSSLGKTWLIPTYLYKRAKLFHHSLAYFIVWIVCFMLMMV